MERKSRLLFDRDFIARLERLHLIAGRLAGGSAGQFRSGGLGDGLEFADHRNYSPGDDIRFLDWPCYARLEKMLVRLFHRHSEDDLAIMLDTSASMRPGGKTELFDYSRRVAAAITYIAMGSGSRVILLPFEDRPGRPVRSGRDRSKIFPLLENLSELVARGRTDLPGLAEWFDAGFNNVGWVVLVSDLWVPPGDLPKAFKRFASGGRELVVLHTHFSEDSDPSFGGHLYLEDAETAERMSVDVTGPLRDTYIHKWKQRCARIEKETLRRGGVYVQVPSHMPMEKLILESLQRAGVLG